MESSTTHKAGAIHKARGATLNPQCRFDQQRVEAFDDGWDYGDDEHAPSPQTIVADDVTRTIITRNQSPDIGFDRSINPYRGCEHGCIYCFARPGHAYLGLSPGLDFETKLFAKPDAAQLLAAEISKKSYKPAVIAFGTNTDPYQPVERQRRIMRACLEVLAEYNHPVQITTKSHLVTRDIDILAPMAAKGLASVAVSVTTLNRDLCRLLEPRAATPQKRLEAVAQLSAAGIPTLAMAAPVIPVLTEPELEAILEAARAHGAISAGYILLRLPGEVAPLFDQWLRDHFPLKANHILSLIRQSRGGALYRADWNKRMAGTGAFAQLLSQRFAKAVKRLGYEPFDMNPRTDLFKVPPKAGDQLLLL